MATKHASSMMNLLRASVIQTVQNEIPRNFTFSELEALSKQSLIHIVLKLQKDRLSLQNQLAAFEMGSDVDCVSNKDEDPGSGLSDRGLSDLDEEGKLSVATWSDVVGDVSDSHEMCDSWTLRDCPSCRRILFCLRYYGQWMRHKLEEQRLNCTLPPPPSPYPHRQHLKDFVDSLSGYSSVSMLNDFHHIKQFHIGHNHGVLDFFRKELGHCQYTECRCYSRNNRDRGKFTQNVPLRRKMYFVPDPKSTVKFGDDAVSLDKGSEIEECNVQQLLDMIHCATMHCTEGTSGRSSRNSKFVTVIGGDGQKVEEEEEPAPVVESYGFGLQFKYHEKGHKNYVAARWGGLKEEILCNALYTIRYSH